MIVWLPSLLLAASFVVVSGTYADCEDDDISPFNATMPSSDVFIEYTSSQVEKGSRRLLDVEERKTRDVFRPYRVHRHIQRLLHVSRRPAIRRVGFTQSRRRFVAISTANESGDRLSDRFRAHSGSSNAKSVEKSTTIYRLQLGNNAPKGVEALKGHRLVKRVTPQRMVTRTIHSRGRGRGTPVVTMCLFQLLMGAHFLVYVESRGIPVPCREGDTPCWTLNWKSRYV